MKNKLIELKKQKGIEALLPQALPRDVLEVFQHFADPIIAGDSASINRAHLRYAAFHWYVETLWHEAYPDDVLNDHPLLLKHFCQSLRREDFVRNGICELKHAYTIKNIWTGDHPLAWESREKLNNYMNKRQLPMPGPN